MLDPWQHLLRVFKRMVKFGLVGGSGTILYLILLYVLTDVVGLWYMISAAIGSGLMFFYSFTLNSIWTFKGRE